MRAQWAEGCGGGHSDAGETGDYASVASRRRQFREQCCNNILAPAVLATNYDILHDFLFRQDESSFEDTNL